MAKISRAQLRLMEQARENRRQIVAAGLSRRDLMKMGLLTSAGYLIPKKGLSATGSGGTPPSPPTTPFVDPLPIPPLMQPVTSLNPAPTAAPQAGEGRTRNHQAFSSHPPQKLYEIRQQLAEVIVSPDLPTQRMWGFNGMVPGPTYVTHYGEPILVRNYNNLPASNDGFGLNSVSTHLHNAHTPSESDGFPCDFFPVGQFYDQHYPCEYAGFSQANGALTPDGSGGQYDYHNETLSTLWYHDHRVDFTAQNVYKGLAGFFLMFGETDTGDVSTGAHLPHFPNFDVPLLLADRVFDSQGLLFFDLFNLDGILGDKFLVNGKIQPFFEVEPRRYRFRVLDGGPSRFYRLFLTKLNNLSAVNRFWLISNDGNLLPKPLQVSDITLGVAERMDIIIDFSQYAGQTICLENRLEQKDGRGPTGKTLPAGQGDLLLQFRVTKPLSSTDTSVDPASISEFYDLPPTNATPRVTRTFRFERSNGQWVINKKLMDCNESRFTVQKNSVEKWILQNNSGGWQHPIHIHFEEFQMLKRNGKAIPNNNPEKSRKDVVRLQFNESVELFFRFRDFKGRYPLHCHNTVHEDHAMMLRWEIDDVGDLKTRP